MAFDRTIIETLRKQADAHVDDPYGTDTPTINWLWFTEMVETLELSLRPDPAKWVSVEDANRVLAEERASLAAARQVSDVMFDLALDEGAAR